MDNQSQDQINATIKQAQQALKNGDKQSVRAWAKQAVQLDPSNEEAWLLLAAASTPKQSIVYLNKALKINPESQRARQGMHWAVERMRKTEEINKLFPRKISTNINTLIKTGNSKRTANKKSKTQPKPTLEKPARREVWPIVLFVAVVVTGLGLFIWFGLPLLTVQAAESIGAPRPESGLLKPTLTPIITPTPVETPTPFPTLTPIPTSTLVQSYMSYFARSWEIPEHVSGGSDFWVEVDLSEQMLYAYEGSTLLNSFPVSTGTSKTPTVTGIYKIYAMYRSYTMRGPGYFLPDVPYSIFFYKGYSIHGTYWHNNFGTPMSKGCVNMETSAAAWVYERANIGTYVFVHK